MVKFAHARVTTGHVEYGWILFVTYSKLILVIFLISGYCLLRVETAIDVKDVGVPTRPIHIVVDLATVHFRDQTVTRAMLVVTHVHLRAN